MTKYQLFINGDWFEAVLGRTFESINPRTGNVQLDKACLS